MLKLGNFRVQWQHSNPFRDLVIFDKYGRKYMRQISGKEFFGTKCFIYPLDKEEEGVILSIGVAKLHRDSGWGSVTYDIFDKEIGRKLSLEKALAQLPLTKEEKREIWYDYSTRD